MTTSLDTLAVWWLDQKDMEAIGDELPFYFPDWLRDEYIGLRGRAGRGRLWVASHFGEVGIDPWPDTPLAKRLEWCGGIVVNRECLLILEPMPGLITDLKLRRTSDSSKGAK